MLQIADMQDEFRMNYSTFSERLVAMYARASSESLLIGAVFSTFSAFCLLFNLTVMCAIFREKLLTKGDPIYVLSTFVIVDPTIRLIFCTFIWGPSCAFKYDLFGRDVINFTSFIACACFLNFSVLQGVIALNRYFTIMNHPWLDIFTRKFCIIFVCSCLPLFFVVVVIAYEIFPCCPIRFNPYIFMFSFEMQDEQVMNALDKYVYTPCGLFGIIIPLYCYLRIFNITRNKQHIINVKLMPNCTNITGRPKKEQPRTLEFLIIFIFYIVFFLGLKYNHHMPKQTPRYIYAVAMFFGIVDAVSISLIQAVLNKRIRRGIKNIFRAIKSTSIGVLPTVSTDHHSKQHHTSSNTNTQ